MKEEYYTISSISGQSREFLRNIRVMRDKRDWRFYPEKSALLILDMQQYFLTPSCHAFIPSAPAITGRIVELVNFFFANNRPVIYTRHLNTTQNSKNMKKWWRELIEEQNPLSKITSLLPTKGCLVIKKTQYDAFLETGLEELLAKKNICQVIVTGVMTHLCCESTARSAFHRGFEVFFGIDTTATYNRNFHMASLTNLAHGFAVPVCTTELINFNKVK